MSAQEHSHTHTPHRQSQMLSSGSPTKNSFKTNSRLFEYYLKTSLRECEDYQISVRLLQQLYKTTRLWLRSGVHKTGIRGIQDTRQIVDGKTNDIENSDKEGGSKPLT